MTWTTRELAIFETTSRVGSIFSLLGAGFIIVTFCVSRAFHKPINRLAFFASFGNILTNVATLISRDGIRAYHDNPQAPICKMQSMFIQWFMPADALFCAAMALNVYLTVFRKYSSHRLQQLEIPYIIICYGVPFIPSMVFLFIHKQENGVTKPLYGPATLWCWVSDEWKIFRIATFYGPVWIVLVFTFSIYILAGNVIFKLRGSLRFFARGELSSVSTGTGNYGSGGGTVTSLPPAASVNQGVTRAQNSNAQGDQSNIPNTSATVPILRDPGPVAGVGMLQPQGYPSYSCTVESPGMNIPPISNAVITARQKSAVEANTAAWAYCRCAMLFFLALVITWLPSSINRVYNIIQPGRTSFSLNFASALVLPCQGFWNGLIYIITTFPACKQFFYQIQNRFRSWTEQCTSRRFGWGLRCQEDPTKSDRVRNNRESIG
ncbi:hypothetical protein L211DRAFT_855979 [Terfezia boudieri ATCC MYA-4762]|uniref:G-protein coupled receptors family 2 profile 2 domain-containing protein n=1 Tax=Terfezia boudieri ATCC MYA-4762 TaxID=1051890 RepID=A0A3N4LZG7_9PEZI|nr:hypothetical protein L211DRAFT_855979 [Terfezia boudieri ATCC MYA-4762]